MLSHEQRMSGRVLIPVLAALAGVVVGWFARDFHIAGIERPDEASDQRKVDAPSMPVAAIEPEQPQRDDLDAMLESGADFDVVLDRLESMERAIGADAHRKQRDGVLSVAERWLQQRRVLEAVGLLERYRERYLHDGRASMMLSDLYQMAGRPEDALPVLFDVVAYPADPTEAKLARDRIKLLEQTHALLLTQRHELEAAVRFYRFLLTLDPTNDEYRMSAAQWLIELGQFGAAVDELAEVGADPEGRAARLAERASLGNTGVAVRSVGEQLLAEIHIGGQPVTLLVDTGATHTSLEPEVLERLRAARVRDGVAVRTAAGLVNVSVFRVSDVVLGTLELPAQDVLALNANLPGVDGLLGMDLLRRVGLPSLPPRTPEAP